VIVEEDKWKEFEHDDADSNNPLGSRFIPPYNIFFLLPNG